MAIIDPNLPTAPRMTGIWYTYRSKDGSRYANFTKRLSEADVERGGLVWVGENAVAPPTYQFGGGVGGSSSSGQTKITWEGYEQEGPTPPGPAGGYFDSRGNLRDAAGGIQPPPTGPGVIPTATPGPVAPLPGPAPAATPGPVPPPTGVTPSRTDAGGQMSSYFNPATGLYEAYVPNLPGNSPFATKEAIFARTKELIATGLSPEEALAQATRELGGGGAPAAGGAPVGVGGQVGPGAGPGPAGPGAGLGGLGGTPGGAGAGVGAGPGDITDLRRELDTGSLFTAALNQQMPQGGFGPFGNYLRRQEGDLTNLYTYGQLSGDVPDPVSFKDFLGSRGGINRVDPTAFGAYATRGASALSGPPTDENAAFREYLQQDPNRQFTLASAGGMPNLAREARGYYNKAARDAFEQFRYDRPAEDFLPWYVGRGQRFF